MYNDKGLSVPVSILNPKSYVISTTDIGLILLCHSLNLTRRVKHVLNNIIDCKVPYGRGVKWYCFAISIIIPCLMVYYIASVLFLLFF